MKKILILGCMLLGLIPVNAQKEYFFYFQSENSVPFFLKMNDKVYSASAEGYLILPRLMDSTYVFSVGRAGKETLESRFSVPVNGKDRGFLIRESESRLQLFDMQSLRMIQPSEPGSRSGTSFIRKDDPFTKLLALAADDSSLLYVYQEPEKPKVQAPEAAMVKVTETETIKDPVQRGTAEEESVVTAQAKDTTARRGSGETIPVTSVASLPVADTVAIAQAAPIIDTPTLKPRKINPDANAQVENNTAADTVALQPNPETITAAVEEPARKEYYKKSVVMRRSESSTTEGFGLVFLDNHGAGVDTIRILIPNPKIVYQRPADEETQETKKFLDLTTDPAPQDTVAVEKPVARQTAGCTAVAGNADFLRLRKYMAAREREEDMVAEAKKYFRSKCFTTAQIRHLSALFLTDRGKFLFFDAAIRRVTDRQQFGQLQSELEDSYFIDRFKVLIGN